MKKRIAEGLLNLLRMAFAGLLVLGLGGGGTPGLASNPTATFDFSSYNLGTGANARGVSQTVSGVTVTVTTNSGQALGVASSYVMDYSNSGTTLTLTFDYAINVSSFKVGFSSNSGFVGQAIFSGSDGSTFTVADGYNSLLSSSGTPVYTANTSSWGAVNWIKVQFDGGGTVSFVTDTIVFTVPNFPPSAIQLSNTLVDNGLTAATVGTLTATDLSQVGNDTYSFTSNPNTTFAISGNTLSFAPGVVSDIYKAPYSITIRVTNPGTGLHFDQAFTIDVNPPTVTTGLPTSITVAQAGSAGLYTWLPASNGTLTTAPSHGSLQFYWTGDGQPYSWISYDTVSNNLLYQGDIIRYVQDGGATLTDSFVIDGVTYGVNQLAAPSIFGQPVNASVIVGHNTSFAVSATGTSLNYQWQVNTGSGFGNVTDGGVYGGATTATLNITGATGSMNGYTYRVVITGSVAPAATSNTVTLSVISPPTISQAFSPTSIARSASSTLTFTITNPNATALTGVAFTETLPAGLVVAAPNGLTGGTGGGTFTATAGTSSISLTGATVAGNGTLTFSVNITGATSGVKMAVSGAISSTEGGTGSTSNSAALTVLSPATLSQAFGVASVPLNGSTTLTFTVSNANATALTGVAFNETLPAGLVVATPNGLTGGTGGGTCTATAGSGSISLTGATVAGNGTLTFSVDVTGTTAGGKSATSGAISSTEGGTGSTSNTASLNVISPATLSQAFGAASVPLNGSTTLTFTVSNANATAQTGVAFSETLPAGLVVATPNGLTGGTGGGTLTATAGSGSISLTGATVAGNGTLTFSVDVTGTTAGGKSATSGAISSTEGGAGSTSNTASLNVISPATLSQAFGAASVPLNGSTTLTFTVSNPNATAQTGVAFSETLPAGLVVATPNGLTGGTGGGTLTATAGSGSISLSGATLAGNGTLTFSVDVTGTTAGGKSATSGAISSTEGGTGSTSNSASLSVISPATLSQAFGALSIPLNGSTSLTFTVSNPNPSALTGLAFSETLPAGMVVATPNGLTGGAGGGTLTATAGSGSISLSGATLAGNGTLTFSVDVTGTTAGGKSATSGAISSTEGGTGSTSNSASLSVISPATLSQAFGALSIPLNGSTSLTFTVSNPNPSALTGLAFSETLPAGLVVATPNGLTGGTGGGTLTATAGSGSISLTGATVAGNGSLTFSVNVTGTTAGGKSATSGAISSTEGGTGSTSNSASLSVIAPASLAQAFSAASISINSNTTLTFTVSNPNASTLTGLAFTETLPAGLVIATPNGLTGGTGGGTFTATAGGSSISLSGAIVAGNGTLTFALDVTGTSPGVKSATTSTIASTEGGAGASANASLLVIGLPIVTTQAVTSVTPTSATGNGNLTATNGANAIAEGVVVYPWSNSDKQIGDAGVVNVSTSGDFSTGAFTAALTPLAVNTQYNARAYASNSAGTGYGTRIAFWTLANVPAAPTVNNPTNTTLNVQVNGNGNPALTEFCIQEASTGKYVQANGSLGLGQVWQNAGSWGTKTVTGLTPAVSYSFQAKARNGAATETGYGPAANGTPFVPPSISGQPANATVLVGNNTSFSVTVAGTGPYYHWQVNTGSGFSNITDGGVYTGANSATLTITGARADMNGYRYQVFVTPPIGPAVTSNSALLTVNAPAAITTQPADVRAPISWAANFSVTATGLPAPSYRWQRSNDGGATWNDIPSAISAIYGLASVALADNGARFRVVVSNGIGSPVTSAAAKLTVATAVSDFNGDGTSDLLWRNSVNGLAFNMPMLNGAPQPGTVVWTEASPAWQIVATGDLDGDGKADQIWWNSVTGQVFGVLMNGPTVKASGLIHTEPNTTWRIAAVADFSGTGKAGLLWRNSVSGLVYLMPMNGLVQQPGGVIWVEADPAWQIMAAADFDGDGKAEILWQNRTSGLVFLMKPNGIGQASGDGIYSEPNRDWLIVGAGDFAGTGTASVLWRNLSNGQVFVMPMSGGIPQPGTIVWTEASKDWHIAAIGDYDGDGKADILWWNSATGQVFQVLMNGTGLKSAGFIYVEPNTAWTLQGGGTVPNP